MTEAYWLWTEDVSFSKTQPVASIRNLRDIMPEIIRFGPLAGRTLPDDFPQLRLNARTQRPLPDYFVAGMFRFVSARLRQCLEETRIQAVEYRPAAVDRQGEVLRESHFLFHVSLALDCLDRQRSVYQVEDSPKGPYVSKLEGLYLDKAKIGLQQLFVMGTPGAESKLIAADGLAEILLRSGCTGFAFKAPEDVSNYFNNPRIKTINS